MAITVTPLLSFFSGTGNTSNCDSATNWSSGTLDTGVFTQGTAAMGLSVSNATSAVILYTCTSTNLSINSRHLYCWLNTISPVDSLAAGGLRIIAGTNATNYRTWYVGGRDTYPGGWQCYVVDPTSAGSIADVGTYNSAAITAVGVQFKTTRTVKAGLINCFWDAVRYGTGLQTTSGAADTITFEDIYTQDDSTANAYGIISKAGGVYYLQGEMLFGSTTAGQHIVFSDNNQVVVFNDQPVNSSLYKISVLGNSTGTTKFQLGTPVGSGSSTIGTAGVTIKSASTSRTYSVNFNNTYTSELKLYSCSLISAGSVYLGDATTALGTTGSTIEFVDNSFISTGRVVQNVSASATKQALRNKVVSNTNTAASFDNILPTIVDSGEWQLINSKGFIHSPSGTTSLTLSNHNFNFATKPYITIAAEAETWNSINPLWTIGTGQTELDFLGSSQGAVNEKYNFNLTVQTPSGTLLQDARTYLYESNNGTGSAAIPSANCQSTDVNGYSTSDILVSNFTATSPSANLAKVTASGFAAKIFKYGYQPSVGAVTVAAAVNLTGTLLDDSYTVTATAATAISNGDVANAITLIEAGTYEHSLIKFTGGSGTLANGNTVTASGASPATGVVVGKIIEGDSTAGTILLQTRNVSTYDNGETLSNGTGWTATYTNSSEQRFHWICNAGFGNNRTIQNVYDYQSAKLDEATIDTVKYWDKVIIWGASTKGFFLERDGEKYKTNVVASKGWAVANLNNLSGVSQFIDNSSVAFTPALTVGVTVTIKDQSGNNISGVEVSIFQNNSSRTVVLASTATDSDGKVTTIVSGGLGAIIIRARQSTSIASFSTGSISSNIITTLVNHNFKSGDSISYSRNGGSVDIGPEPGTFYVGYLSGTTLYLYDSAVNAIAGGATGRQTLTASGSETHLLDPVRYVAASAAGTVGTTDFSAQITMITDTIVTG